MDSDFLQDWSINSSLVSTVDGNEGLYVHTPGSGKGGTFIAFGNDGSAIADALIGGGVAIAEGLKNTYDPGAVSTEAAGATTSVGTENLLSEGTEVGKALYGFLPDEVREEYARQWVKSGDRAVALGATRNTPAWNKHFEYLKRDDGSLVMDELTALSTVATYKQTLSEVGVKDFTDYESQFEKMITDEVSGLEFQQRVDMVYAGVKDQIPEVERLFRERHDIPLDEGTIFGALINPDIQDKILKGEIQTLQIQAEAASRGFSGSFSRFEELRKLGLNQEAAKGLYETAGTLQSMGTRIGTDMTLASLEQAAVGDIDAQNELKLLQGQVSSLSSGKAGAARKDGKYTGLVQD